MVSLQKPDLSSCDTGPLKPWRWRSAGLAYTMFPQFPFQCHWLWFTWAKHKTVGRIFHLVWNQLSLFIVLLKNLCFSHCRNGMHIAQGKLNHHEGGPEKYNRHISLEKLQILSIFLCLPAFCIIFSCTSWINVPSNKEKSDDGNVIMSKFYLDPSKINWLFLPKIQYFNMSFLWAYLYPF